MRVIMTAEQIAADPAAWLAARRKGISASEIASIFRVQDAFEQPIQVYWRKIQGLDHPGTMTMEYARYQEGWATRCYAAAEPAAVLEDGPLACHSKRRWQIASFDLLDWSSGVGTVRPVEIKAVYNWRGWGDPPHGEIPPRYQAQGIWQGDVADAEEVRVIAVNRSTGQPKIYWIDMDAKARRDAALMREAAEEFRARLADRRPPPVSYSAGALDLLRAVYPVVDEAIVMPARLRDRLHARYRRLQDAKAAYGLAELEVREQLRSGTRAITSDGTVFATRSRYVPRRVSVAEVRERYPEVAAECTREGDPIDKLYIRGTSPDDNQEG